MYWIRMLYPFLVLSALCFMAVRCTSSSKKKTSLTRKQIHQMNQALSFSQNQEFLKGAAIYDQLFDAVKDKSSKTLVLFNAGVAYKEAGHCDKALTRYRKLLDYAIDNSSLKARGLIEISYAYECLGKEELALISLKDAEPVLNSLPWTLAQLAYPARLAIAHARLGKISQANHYRDLSLKKVLRSRTVFSSEEELKDKISRMFYIMGRSYVQKESIHPEAFVKAFSYHQIYLLQSLFLRHKMWSGLAKKELDRLFEKLNFALLKFRKKQKYETLIKEALKDAHILIKKEQSEEWETWYLQKSQSVLKSLSNNGRSSLSSVYSSKNHQQFKRS